MVSNQGCTQLVNNIKQENRFCLEIEANFALFTELIFRDETDTMTMIMKSQLNEDKMNLSWDVTKARRQ